MTSEEILETIQELLETNLDIDPDDVELDSTVSSLGIDSLDMVELICQLEEECNVELDDTDDLVTIGDLVSAIEDIQ